MLRNGRSKITFEAELKTLVTSSVNILDVGTSCRFAKELRPYENWFEGKNYVAAGYNPDSKYGQYTCDCHQDIESMTFDSESFDAVICLEVLEHVKNPFKASEEINRVLRKGGRFFISVPFLTSYHGKGSLSQGHDSYPDYWRFTHEGLFQLFHGASEKSVIPLDGPLEMRLAFLRLGDVMRWNPIGSIIDFLDRPRVGKSTTRHLLVGKK
jgi:SAM-dependent methyltransferase